MEVDIYLRNRALLCLCRFDPPPKKGRPKNKRDFTKADAFQSICSMACKIKSEANRLDGKKPNSFVGAWEQYNSSMARPKKINHESWHCSLILKELIELELPSSDLVRQAIKRFELSDKDVISFDVISCEIRFNELKQ